MTGNLVVKARTRLNGLIRQVEDREVLQLTRDGNSVTVLISETDYAALHTDRAPPGLWDASDEWCAQTAFERPDLSPAKADGESSIGPTDIPGRNQHSARASSSGLGWSAGVLVDALRLSTLQDLLWLAHSVPTLTSECGVDAERNLVLQFPATVRPGPQGIAVLIDPRCPS